MLGRKSFEESEIAAAAARLRQGVDAWRQLAGGATGNLAQAEAAYASNLLVALDRPFIHRVRTVAGKTTNPLNELELIVESLTTNGGVFEPGTVIKYIADASTLGLEAGQEIALTVDDVEDLGAGVIAQLRTVS